MIFRLIFQDGATALFIAAQNGHERILEILLEQGAKTDAARTDGATALWIAAQMGHDHIVRRLLKAGAKVDATRHVMHTFSCFNYNPNSKRKNCLNKRHARSAWQLQLFFYR